MGLGRLISDEARSPELGHAVGEHRLDHLLLCERLAPDLARLRERRRFLDETRGCAAAARGDHEPLAPEPGMREAHAVTLRTEPVRLRHEDVLEPVRRVVSAERMAEE